MTLPDLHQEQEDNQRDLSLQCLQEEMLLDLTYRKYHLRTTSLLAHQAAQEDRTQLPLKGQPGQREDPDRTEEEDVILPILETPGMKVTNQILAGQEEEEDLPTGTVTNEEAVTRELKIMRERSKF